jgi:hypothetical protein
MKYMNLNLPIPKEPEDVKEWIKSFEQKGQTPGIDWASLNVWYGNQLPKYLWREWKSELKRVGFNWQKFLKILKYRTDRIILWSNNEMSWEELVKEIIKLISSPLGEHITKRE